MQNPILYNLRTSLPTSFRQTWQESFFVSFMRLTPRCLWSVPTKRSKFECLKMTNEWKIPARWRCVGWWRPYQQAFSRERVCRWRRSPKILRAKTIRAQNRTPRPVSRRKLVLGFGIWGFFFPLREIVSKREPVWRQFPGSSRILRQLVLRQRRRSNSTRFPSHDKKKSTRIFFHSHPQQQAQPCL